MLLDLVRALVGLALVVVPAIVYVWFFLREPDRDVVIIDDAVPRKLPRRVLREIRWEQSSGVELAIPLLWVLFLIRWLAGFDVIQFARGERPIPSLYYLILASALSATALVCVWWFTRKSLHLAKHGVLFEAAIATWPFEHMGQQPVTYSYVVGSRTFKNTVDLAQSEIQRARERGTLPVLVDPKRPRISRPLCKITHLLRHVRVGQ